MNTTVRRNASLALATTIALVGASLTMSPAFAADLSAPSELAASAGGSTTPTLAWKGVRGAKLYEVQVDDDASFSTPNYKISTANTRAVPDSHMPSGTVFWRVRATSGKDASSWAKSQVSVNAADVPAPTHPADGATLVQPNQPPLLRWGVSRGATSYTIQLDGDSDFIGGKTFTTKSTSFVVPDALSTGDWFWRVVANKGASIVSAPSPTMSFIISPLVAPTLTSPNDTFEETVEDVRVDWDPVPGAATYDLQIALDADFNNFAFTATKLRGTAYSPPTTLNNDEFWWRVRAVDAAGVSTPWQASRFNFKRQWLDQPQALHPTGSSVSPGLQDTNTTYFSWTPAQHATHYQLEVADNIGFNGASSCTPPVSTSSTAVTTFAPRNMVSTGASANDCLVPATTDLNAKKVYWWRVRPMDVPYEDPHGLPGVWSTPNAFYRTPQVVQGSPPATPEALQTAWATGLKVSMTGPGAKDGGKGCVSTPSVGYPIQGSYTAPSVCETLAATPVLSWNAMPGMKSYRVWFAQDENFTTTEVQPIVTSNTMLTLDHREKAAPDKWLLPENQPGKPYYWHVQACTGPAATGDCSPRPDSLVVGIGGAAAFAKVSPVVTGLHSTDGSQDDISFYWDDYLTSNTATTSYGEQGHQTARQYNVQVSTDPGFASVIDTATVDQATYTAGTELYPQGTIYWRVRAIDAQKNALPWSAPASVTKSTAPVALTAPINGVQVAGTTPFEWAPQSFASSYTLEVYRNGDTAFSPGNQVLGVTTTATAYAPSTPLPASNTPYIWRVRKTDNSKNPGSWSTPGAFFSIGAAPVLLSPADGARVRATNGLFEWSDVPGAASYEVRATAAGGLTMVEETVATAWAPSKILDGRWTWRVTARDAADQPLGTSAGREFVVDGTAPKVIKVKPAKPKTTSTLVVMFSESVKNVTKSTMQLTIKGVKGKKAKIKAKVKLSGAKATLNPTAKLKRGKTYVIKFKPTITDLFGNTLAATKREIRVK